MLLGLSGFITIRLGFFPVALVNNHFISEKYFEEIAKEIIYGLSPYSSLPSNAELKRLALKQVIENELMYREAKKYFGSIIQKDKKTTSILALLSEQVRENGSSFEDWFVDAKRGANVYIFISGYKWNGESVLFNN